MADVCPSMGGATRRMMRQLLGLDQKTVWTVLSQISN